MSPPPALVWLPLALLLGCGSTLGGALEEFDAGRHPEAAQRFRTLEATLPELGPRERLRYALYRGLNDLALGNAPSAERWLTPVKRSVDREPLTLTHEERGRLLAAWRSLGRMPGE